MATRIGLIADTHIPEARAPIAHRSARIPISRLLASSSASPWTRLLVFRHFQPKMSTPLVIPLGKTFDQPSINFSISRL